MEKRVEQLETELKRRTEQEHPATGLPREKNAVVDFDGIKLRMVHYCLENDIPYESSVPLDRSKDANGGLDDVKLIKAFNDDKSTGVQVGQANQLVAQFTESPDLGLLGQPRVNVLKLNLALDQEFPRK